MLSSTENRILQCLYLLQNNERSFYLLFKPYDISHCNWRWKETKYFVQFQWRFFNLDKKLKFRRHLFSFCRTFNALELWDTLTMALGCHPSLRRFCTNIRRDIHRVLNECIRWGLPRWIHAFIWGEHLQYWCTNFIMIILLCRNQIYSNFKWYGCNVSK